MTDWTRYSHPRATIGVTDCECGAQIQVFIAVRYGGQYYPARGTAFKSLLDRTKINGTSLPKLAKQVLADTLNACLSLYKDGALLLIRDQKVSAVHSGDEKDYSVLPIDELMTALKTKLDERFPGSEFERGYTDHSLTGASFTLPNQREELLDAYAKLLESQGKKAFADKLTPGIRFSTSDVGVCAAKVSALLMGLPYPIAIGGEVSTEHRGQARVANFSGKLDMLFAQFEDAVRRLQGLAGVYLDYPVNAMTAVCKMLRLRAVSGLD